MILRFVANSEKCRKYTFLGGSAQIITILHKGVIKIYYNITWGVGSFGTPNLYYVIYGRPLRGGNMVEALDQSQISSEFGEKRPGWYFMARCWSWTICPSPGLTDWRGMRRQRKWELEVYNQSQTSTISNQFLQITLFTIFDQSQTPANTLL